MRNFKATYTTLPTGDVEAMYSCEVTLFQAQYFKSEPTTDMLIRAEKDARRQMDSFAAREIEVGMDVTINGAPFTVAAIGINKNGDATARLAALGD